MPLKVWIKAKKSERKCPLISGAATLFRSLVAQTPRMWVELVMSGTSFV